MDQKKPTLRRCLAMVLALLILLPCFALPADSSGTGSIWTAYNRARVRIYSTGSFSARVEGNDALADAKPSWSSSDSAVLIIDESGSYAALSVGHATVTVTVGELTRSFDVEVADEYAFTWYSQKNMYTSNWDASLLSKLTFYGDGKLKKYAVDEKAVGNRGSWMDEGCAICCSAMVLNNLGAKKTYGYDLRTGQTDDLPADPYTVSLANTGNNGATYATQKLYGDPVTVEWATVARAFNVDGAAVNATRVYTSSLKRIKELLEEHPAGVIVKLYGRSQNHFVVFSECINPDETDPSKLRFKAYDPLAYDPAEGDGVPFEKTRAYRLGYTYSDITSVVIYDVVK